VIGESDELHDVIASGEEVNANINQRLIENIFFKNSPLHDGAMIIVSDRIEAAACILPLSQSEELPKEFGLRHRSAMGISEKTNAVAVVVSEETGIISVFRKGSFRRNLAAQDIAKYLAENVR
jgi:DNA integrity scanning protein DisA with diadenylate cyclase activity